MSEKEAKVVFSKLNKMIMKFRPSLWGSQQKQELHSDLMRSTVPTIKKQLKEMGLSTTGKKSELVKRLSHGDNATEVIKVEEKRVGREQKLAFAKGVRGDVRDKLTPDIQHMIGDILTKRGPSKKVVLGTFKESSDLTQMKKLLSSVNMNELLSFITEGEDSIVPWSPPKQPRNMPYSKYEQLLQQSDSVREQSIMYRNPLFTCYSLVLDAHNYEASREVHRDAWSDIYKDILMIFDLLLKHIDVNEKANVSTIGSIIQKLSEDAKVSGRGVPHTKAYIPFLASMIRNGLDIDRQIPWRRERHEQLGYRPYWGQPALDHGGSVNKSFRDLIPEEALKKIEPPAQELVKRDQLLALSQSMTRQGADSPFGDMGPDILGLIKDNVEKTKAGPRVLGKYYSERSSSPLQKAKQQKKKKKARTLLMRKKKKKIKLLRDKAKRLYTKKKSKSKPSTKSKSKTKSSS